MFFSCMTELRAHVFAGLLMLAITVPAAAGDAGKVAGAELGAKLFQDTSLSRDGTIACSSCHDPRRAYTDGHAQSRGVGGLVGTRNAPSLLDVAAQAPLFWDGRQMQLERLIREPLLGPREHGLADVKDLRDRLQANATYRDGLRDAYPESVDQPLDDLAVRALADFLRGLKSGESAFDRHLRGDTQALQPEQLRGLALFQGRAGCSACHRVEGSRPALTDHGFHNHGIASARIADRLTQLVQQAAALAPARLSAVIQEDAQLAALGRYLVTGNPADIGRFRTPALRNVAITAPYMHDGSVATLRAAVDHELYYSAADRGAGFSHEERDALVAFLAALTDGAAVAPVYDATAVAVAPD